VCTEPIESRSKVPTGGEERGGNYEHGGVVVLVRGGGIMFQGCFKGQFRRGRLLRWRPITWEEE
jgi:hypothetical protein